MSSADAYEEIIKSYENSLTAVENRINYLIENRHTAMVNFESVEKFESITSRIDVLRVEKFELMNTIGHMKDYVNTVREREANSNGDTLGQ